MLCYSYPLRRNVRLASGVTTKWPRSGALSLAVYRLVVPRGWRIAAAVVVRLSLVAAIGKKKRKKDVFREPSGRLVAAYALATGHSFSGRVWGRRVSLLQHAPLAVGAPLRVDAVAKAHRFADQGPGWAKEPEKQEKKKAASETTPWRKNNLGHAHGKLTKGSGQSSSFISAVFLVAGCTPQSEKG